MPQLFYFQTVEGETESITLSVLPDRNWAMLCPGCGVVWGRVAVEAPGTRWLPLLRGCSIPHARDGLDMPGSLMLDKEILRPWAMPRKMLLRELSLAEHGGGVAYPIAAWYNPHSSSTELLMAPELASRIAELRDKTLKGTITMEELQEGMKALREDRRFAAAKAGAATRTSRAASPINTDDLLKSFF